MKLDWHSILIGKMARRRLVLDAFLLMCLVLMALLFADVFAMPGHSYADVQPPLTAHAMIPLMVRPANTFPGFSSSKHSAITLIAPTLKLIHRPFARSCPIAAILSGSYPINLPVSSSSAV